MHRAVRPGIGILLLAFGGCAHAPAPSATATMPEVVAPQAPPSDSALSLRVAAATRVTVYRIDPTLVEGCEAVAGAGTGAVLCHPIIGSPTVPGDPWARKMAALVLWRVVRQDPLVEPDLRPAVAVRFEFDDATTDVLLSLYHRRLRIESTGLPTAYGSFGDRYYDFLSVIGEAFPDDEEIQALVAVEEQDRRETAARAKEDAAARPAYQRPIDCSTSDPPEFTEYDTEPTPAVQVKPDYPVFAREAMIQGSVVLRVFVNSDGTICTIKVKKSITGLDQAAISALKQWQFNPASLKGVPVGAWLDVPMIFHLN